MKKIIIHTLVAAAMTAGFSACGDSFLETKFHKGQDLDQGLTSVSAVDAALNGTYDRFYDYRFVGRDAIAMGDIASDLSYWNAETSHWNEHYSFSLQESDLYLAECWAYGYKAIDAANRILRDAAKLYDGATDAEKKTLDRDMAEAYALRGFARLYLTNIFGHQVKVNGKDFSDQPGIVITDKVVSTTEQVKRATVGESYAAIVSDFKNALTRFTAAGGDRGSQVYLGVAAVHGLLARTYLYLENWSEAAASAQAALTTSKITELAKTKADYKALYAGELTNKESIFALAINGTKNFGSASLGTVWTTYSYSPSPKLRKMYKSTDVRTVIMDRDPKKGNESVPYYLGGKFANAAGTPANSSNYMINAPEMYLIQAEALLQKGDLDGSRKALLVVAGRDVSIKAVSDLPQTKDALYSFIKDERARELFQEGFRLWDLRRWDTSAEVYAFGAPEVKFTFTGYKISDFVYPIPVGEVNAGFGVTQTPGWSDALPKK